MSILVAKVVNLAPGDLVVWHDPDTATLYIMLGPLTLGREAAIILDPGESLEFAGEAEKA